MRSYQIWWEVITWELLRQYVHFYSTFVGELISHGITFQMHLKLIFQETFQTDFASKRQLMHGITTQLHVKLILQRIACKADFTRTDYLCIVFEEDLHSIYYITIYYFSIYYIFDWQNSKIFPLTLISQFRFLPFKLEHFQRSLLMLLLLSKCRTRLQLLKPHILSSQTSKWKFYKCLWNERDLLHSSPFVASLSFHSQAAIRWILFVDIKAYWKRNNNTSIILPGRQLGETNGRSCEVSSSCQRHLAIFLPKPLKPKRLNVKVKIKV